MERARYEETYDEYDDYDDRPRWPVARVPSREEKSAHRQNTIVNGLIITIVVATTYLAWPMIVTMFQVRTGIIAAPTEQPSALPTRPPSGGGGNNGGGSGNGGSAAGSGGAAAPTPVPAVPTATAAAESTPPCTGGDPGGVNLDTSVHVGSDGVSVGGAASVGNGSAPDCGSADTATTQSTRATPTPIGYYNPVRPTMEAAITMPPISAEQAAVINAQTRFTPADGIPCGPRDSRRACLDHADHIAPTPVVEP